MMLMNNKFLLFLFPFLIVLLIPLSCFGANQSDYVQSITDDNLVNELGFDYPVLKFDGVVSDVDVQTTFYVLIPPSQVQDILLSDGAFFIPSNISCFVVCNYDCFNVDGYNTNLIFSDNINQLMNSTFYDIGLVSCYFPDSITTYSTYDDDELLKKIDNLTSEVKKCQSNSEVGSSQFDDSSLLDKFDDVIFLIQAQNTWFLYIIAFAVAIGVCIILFKTIKSCMTY